MSIDRAKALKAAQKYLAKGQVDRAITEYEQIVSVDGDDGRSLLKLGDLYARQGNSKGAAASYRKVAAQYADQGFFLKAVSVYKQILKLEPNDLSALEGLAAMYEMLRLASDALATYEQLADGHVRAGKPEKALLALGKLAELDPENVSAWIRHAEALSRADRIDDAVIAFCHGADLLKRQGRVEDFIKVTERLLFHTHDHLDRARELASLYIARGQTKAALAHLQTCFKTDPKNVETLGLLASAFTTLGQTPKAISVFREIARVHADAGEAQDEANALRGLLALDPTDASAQKKLKSLVEASAPTTLDDDDAELLSEEDDDLLMVDDDAASSPPRPSSPPPVELERQALIARLLAECEVFVRYGLRDKIIAQLGRVLELDPNHVEAREKLKEAHVKRGEIAQAVSQLLRLSEIVGADAVSARAYMAEAAALQPDNESIATKLTALKAAAAAQEAEEDEVVFVDETEADRDAEGVPVSGASEVRVQRFSSIPPASSPVSAISEDDDEPEMMLEDGAEDDPIEAEDANSAADSEAIDANEAAATSEELPEAVVEALEEVDFYLAQKLVDEAREALNDALLEHPDHAALLAKLASLDADPSGATETSAAQQAVAPPLATAEAKGAERTAKLAAETATGKQGPLGVEQALQQFREGVRRQVDNSDTATHYDLGIAYMGMGLHAEAIEAFTLCLENPEKRHTAHTMIGLSHVAKGDMSTGISHFKQALVSPQCTPEDEVGLWFEIGNASELSGKASEALIWYEKVEEQNPAFRDVSARIERLGMIKTPQQEGDDFDEMFDSMIIKD